MEIEGIEFFDALKLLAERVGIELKTENPSIRNARNRDLALMEEAARFFEKELLNNKNALAYLQERGLHEDTINLFRIGYAPMEWKSLLPHLESKGFRDDEIERSGLAIRGRESAHTRTVSAQYYDRFRGRIMFPIFDYNGKIIAFGGRIFPERDVEAKYINSPETHLYQKSKVLFGMHRAKTEIIKSGIAVLVEGYMDMLMAYQAGTRNIVAVSGTSLTSDQLRIIHRLCDKLIASFDMDSAGQVAADRGIQLALRDGFDVRVLNLGKFKDPADAVSNNISIWHKAIENPRHIVGFYIDKVCGSVSPDSPEGKRMAEKTVLPVIAALASEFERAHWVKELSNLFSIKEEIIWSALSKIIRGSRAVSEEHVLAVNQLPRSRKELLEERIIGIAARFPDIYGNVGVSFNRNLFSEERAKLFSAIHTNDARNVNNDMLEKLALASELFFNERDVAEAEFVRCYSELEREYIKEEMEKLGAAIKHAESNSSENLPELLSKFHAFSRRLSNIH